jgi:putative transposase
MPWSVTDLMSIRFEFVAEARAKRQPITALCAQYGISEKTGHKWLARFRAGGPPALENASHTARRCPHRTPEVQRTQLLALRQLHPTWGARKLRARLKVTHPRLTWPAPSTITTLLHQAQLIRARPRHRRAGAAPLGADPLRGPRTATEPNALWTIDYKGQFRTADGCWCYPLTIVDAASRYLLACVAHRAPSRLAARQVLVRCFRRYGLPAMLLSDNGAPFGAARAPRGFSQLSLWVRTLGIQPRFIIPGHPEHNGRHERFHRTLKAEATRPPAATRRAQQRRFEAYRREYNDERPHEALGLVTPATLFQPSPRPFVARPAPLVYPPHYHVRRITSAGLLWWHQQDVYVSQALAGHRVGIDPVSPNQWHLYFAEYLLGAVDLTTLHFVPLGHDLGPPINPV